jgi:hypothetical protein
MAPAPLFAPLQVSRDMITRPAADDTMNISPTASMTLVSFFAWSIKKLERSLPSDY